MSDPYEIDITYEAPYSVENARQLYEAISVGVYRNWAPLFRDTISPEMPPYPPRPDAWTNELEKEGLEEFEASVSPDRGMRHLSIFEHIGLAPRIAFSFSPLSSRRVSANVERTEHGMIRLHMDLYRNTIWQLRRDRVTSPSHQEYRPQPGDNATGEERSAYKYWLASLPDDDVSESNKLLLLMFVRHLVTVFPVWRLEIDPALLPDILEFPDGPLFPATP